MLKFFFVLISVLLALLGLCEIVHLICVLVLRPERKSKKILVVFPDNENCEQEIALGLHELSWHGSGYADVLAVVTENVGEAKVKQLSEQFSGTSVVFVKNSGELKIYG